MKEFSFLFVDSPQVYSKKLQELKRKYDSSSSTVPEVQNLGASVKKQGKQYENYSVKCSFTLMTVVLDMQIST